MIQHYNQQQQLILSSQEQQVGVLNERQIVETNLENRARDMGELNKRLLTEVYQICNGNKGDKDENQLCSNIKRSFRKTDSIQDTLYNINQLIPREKDLKESFKDRYLFIKMGENCKELSQININLEYIFSNMEDSMVSYKQKLTSLIELLKGQHEVKSDLGAYIEKYCVQFASEFEKVKNQEKQISNIKSKIQEMRQQEEMLQLGDINKGILDYQLISVFSNQKVQDAQKVIQNKWVDILVKGQVEYEDQFRKTKELQFQINEMEDHLNSLNIKKEQCATYEKDLQMAIDDKKKEKINEDFVKLQQDQENMLQDKKREAIQQLQKIDSEKTNAYQNWSNDIIQKIEQSQTFGNSYNIIFLVDDSGSMHVKPQSGIWKYFTKTPYHILADSIHQFIKKRKYISKFEDIITIIKFSNKSYTLCRREKIENVKVNLDDYPLKSGTNFNLAFKEVAENMKLQTKAKSSILIFQTDGESQQKDECKQYIQDMMELDPNFRMFTLALGEDVNENFLQEITKFANKGNEVLNFGKLNPVSFYQKVADTDCLNRIFDDISLGIDEQISDIYNQMRMNQLQLETQQKQHKDEMEKIKLRFEAEQSIIDEQIQKVKILKSNEDRINYLLQESIETKKNKDQLSQQIQDLKTKLEENKEKLTNQQTLLQLAEKMMKGDLENAKIQIEEAQKEAFSQSQKDDSCIRQKIQCFEEIGERSEAKLMLWAQSIHSFDRYLELIDAFVTKLNRFFTKFKSISNDLQEKIDFSTTTSSSDFKFETQQQIIFSEYPDLSYEQIFQKIFEKQYKGPQNEDQQIYQEALELILKRFRNMHDFLKGMKFNNPKVKLPESKKKKYNDDSDDDIQESAISDLLTNLQDEQENELFEIKGTLLENAKPFLTLQVFNKKFLNNIKKKGEIYKLMEKIEEFQFPEEESDMEEKDQEDQSQDEDNSEILSEDGSESDNTIQLKKSKQLQLKANKEQQKMKLASKQKKKRIMTEEQVVEQKKKLKKSLLEKINQIQKDKALLEAVQQLYDALDSKFEDILQNHTKTKKTEQIKSICEYIQKDIIKPLDELMSFPNSRSNKQTE